MQIIFGKKFVKQFRKLPKRIQVSADRRILLFEKNPAHSSLRNHALTGKFAGYRSINVTGDYRILFQELEDGSIVILALIGTHAQLYE